MQLWQNEAKKEMVAVLEHIINIDRIDLTGSMLDENLLDIYSDVDLEIYLTDNIPLDFTELLDVLTDQVNPVFGYELFNYDTKDVLRLCFENGWRFDLSFIYPAVKKSQLDDSSHKDDGSHCDENSQRDDNSNRDEYSNRDENSNRDESSYKDKTDIVIYRFWFYCIMILIKLGRKDNLVAAHLTLELYRLIIVLQMLQRDNEYTADIHRFGGNEDVPVISLLTRLKESNCKEIIIELLYGAAEYMDEVSGSYGVKSGKTSKLKKIQEELGTSQS